MSDKDKPAEAPVKKKGKMGKMLVLGVGVLVLLGGGVGAGLYASSAGLIGGGGHKEAADPDTPKLVPKSEEVKAGAESGGESGGGEGGESGGGNETVAEGGKPTPEGEGGDRYASSYYAMEKEFTANLADSVHFAQIGVAISTPYDHKVLDNLKTHEIAVRSAVLMALGETTEDQVFTADGKKQLALRLKKAINDTLVQKEGFGGIGNVYFTNFVVQ
ncbi:flagellar basal body protein FliL [Sphingomonas sp. Leaf407]|uniref:flagellar basal body-associated FliL family protein n=1 Tax=unclassified Sphingomonas TaxID=196159 RepID=UPI0006F60D1C|nr:MULTISPECIES: flagellar basal body-associated FliL family protein [unclassified Sphingomonas]KQN39544.1 flagellar basal body protein FliL [Sphingomonas sp. Leaf42]KQT28821.1 flagellar basal body protein FliL [Sphingomonas sp. Leaf407]